MNPYDCSRPGNLFTGYDQERKAVFESLVKGGRRSFAIHGGRRCGKTSLLLRVKEDVEVAASNNVHCHFVDMQSIVPRSAGDLFLAFFREIAKEIPGVASVPDHLRNFQDFLKLIDQNRSSIESQLGGSWRVALLVDDFDLAASTLGDDEAFQNLRSLLTSSPYANNFRLVAAGSSPMNEVIKSGSPLNNLDPIFLGILPEASAESLIQAGFGGGAVPEGVLSESGRHPYILQGILGYLWEDRGLDITAIARRFKRDRMPVFKQWVRDIGSAGVEMFGRLASTNDRVPIRTLKVKGAMRDEVLQVLSYHGLVDDSDSDYVRVSSEIFRRWFLQNIETDLQIPKYDQTTAKAKKVFVVHGRNSKIRASVFQFLREVGLHPLEWGDLVEATGNPAPTIIEVLRNAVDVAHAAVILFTPDDEARLREEFQADDDSAYEVQLTGQPRPNVIFEAGMIMAHFPVRTVIIQVGHLRPFT